MRSKLKLLLMVFSMMLVIQGFSQDIDQNREQLINDDVSLFEFSVDRLLLLNSFKSNVGKNLTGVSFALLNQLDSEDGYAFYGLDVDYTRIGSLSATVNGFFNDYSKSSFITTLFIYRHYLPFYYKILEPYVELGLGPQFFYSATTTTYFDAENSSEVNLEESDFGLAYSLNLSLTIKIIDQVFALIKVGYYGGTATTYLAPTEEVTTLYPIDSFDLRTNSTNYLKIQLGAAYSF